MPRRASLSRSILDTAAGALLGAWVAALGVGAFEVLGGPGGGHDFAAASGLVGVPFAFVALAVAIWVLALHGASRLPLGLLLESAKRRQRLLWLGPLLLVGWWCVSELGLWLSTRLALGPARFASIWAGGALAIIWLGDIGLDVGSTWLGRQRQRPALWLVLSVLALSLVGGGFMLVQLGSPSGTGSPWAILGVLRREELALEPVVALGLGGLCSYVGGLVALRRGMRSRAWWCFFGLLVAMAAGGAAAAVMSPAALLRFERRWGLSSALLSAAGRVLDADGDGASAFFGGGDCDDHDPQRRPGAIDAAGDGIDQDCDGVDAKKMPTSRASIEPSVNGQERPSSPERSSLPEHPNVLLLTIDTLRADLGYTRPPGARPVSPVLDALAARSTVFERAYSLASYTSKSLGPALLGRYPAETARNFDHFDRFSPSVPFVQERLQKAGIHTLSVQGYWYFFFKGYGYERGWDVLDSKAAPKLVSVDADGSSNGDRVATQTIEALRALDGDSRPFFLWAHWIDPHAEYVKHEEFDFGKESRDRYDGEVAFVDAQLGRVLEALERGPRAKDTIVIVTSDHGEAFGEHGMIRHGFELWEELVRVPLVVYVPGLPAARVHARRSAIDLVPTILEIFGQPAPGGDDFLRGTSWVADLGHGGEHSERPILVDMPQGPHNKQRRAFLSGKYKLISGDGRVLGLYDLDADPAEKQDLSQDPALLSRLQAEQAAFLSGLRPLEPQR
jgi:arylsulfatase A-like enzyme